MADSWDSEACGPTLMSLPPETLNQILAYILPDKDVLRLKRGWKGHLAKDVSFEEAEANEDDPYKKYCSYTGEVDVLYQDTCAWKYDDEFRHNRERVQTAILRVNRHLYEVGSRFLYGRTLKVDIWSLRGFGLYDQRSFYSRLKYLPWAKVRKIVLMVHSAIFMVDVEPVREQLLMICGFFVSGDAGIKKLQVIFTGEWDPDKKFVSRRRQFTFEGPLERYYGSEVAVPSLEQEPRLCTMSEVDNLSMMLQPLRQLSQVQECKIQLPPSVQDHPRLADEVNRCIREMDEEPDVEDAELVKDWKKYLSKRKNLAKWEKKDNALWKKQREEENTYKILKRHNIAPEKPPRAHISEPDCKLGIGPGLSRHGIQCRDFRR